MLIHSLLLNKVVVDKLFIEMCLSSCLSFHLFKPFHLWKSLTLLTEKNGPDFTDLSSKETQAQEVFFPNKMEQKWKVMD